MQYLQYLKKKKCYKAKFNKTRYASERNVEDLWNVEEVWLWLKSVRCQLGGNKVQGVTFSEDGEVYLSIVKLSSFESWIKFAEEAERNGMRSLDLEIKKVPFPLK